MQKLTESNLEYSCCRSLGSLFVNKQRLLAPCMLENRFSWMCSSVSYNFTCGTRFASHLTINALSCIGVLHLPWKSELESKVNLNFKLSEAKWTRGFIFTSVTWQCLADAILEFVVFLTFGAYVAVRAELTVGDAGQAGIVSPVGIEPTWAVRPTATLVEETLLSILI